MQNGKETKKSIIVLLVAAMMAGTGFGGYALADDKEPAAAALDG